MTQWILGGTLVWSIVVLWVLCILRLAARSDRRHEDAVRVRREHAAAGVSRSTITANSTRRGGRGGGGRGLAGGSPPACRGAIPTEARLWALGAIGLIAYVLHLALDLGGRQATAFLVAGTVLAAAATCVAASRRRRSERIAWLVLAVAMASYGASIVAYVLIADAAERFPSLADVGLFAFYPLMLIGLVLLVQARLGGLRPALWLDALMGAFAVAALGAVALRPALGDELSTITIGQFAYAEGDLLFLGFLAGTSVFVGRRPSRLVLALAAGAGLLAGGDCAYAVRIAQGSTAPAMLEQVCWLAGLLVLSAAGWQPPRARRPAVRVDWRDVAMPLGAACACLPIALVAHPRGNLLAVVFSGGGLALVLARLSASLAQNVGVLRLEARAAQQAAVAALGRHALEGREVAPLLGEATSAVGELLAADHCEIVELQEQEEDFVLVGGLGWPAGTVDGTRVSADDRSLAGYLLRFREPVSFMELEREQRFEAPLLAASGVTSGAAALISAGGRPFGALGAFSRRRQRFSRDDLYFLEAVANSLRPADTAARLGGDEFAIACELPGGADPSIIAERTIQALQPAVLLDGEQHRVRASIGMAVARSGEATPEDLLRDADAAMYAAKARGGMSHALFSEEMRADAATHRRLEHDLDRALQDGQLTVVYQPIVRLSDGVIVGAEALLRWQHPERGVIPPEVFVPVAEKTGLIVPIGNWVLSEACRQAAAWREQPFTMAINLSPRQLTDPHLPDLVARVLKTTGLPPDQLCVEITESVLIDSASAVNRALAQLKALGLRVALDDFGTGYASLSYLQRFPVDVVKLDRSFIGDLPSRGSSEAIVTSTVALVQALGLTLVTEGVQTHAQAEYLAALGCQLGQGYYFGRPAAPTEVSALLAGRRPQAKNRS